MVDSEMFEGAPDSVVRLARWLAAQDTANLAPQRRLAYAERARTIARGDIALQLLAGFGESEANADVMAARARICVDLMRFDEAGEALARYRGEFGADTRLLALSFAAARAAGGFMPADIDARTFAAVFATAALTEIARSWPSLPFARLPLSFAARAAIAIAPRSPRVGARILARWFAAAGLQVLSRVAVGLLFAALRMRHPGRTIHFAAMGKFTRLADLVDRLDPILRRLAADGGDSRHRLYVLFFGGYPNATLLDLVKRHCTVIEATARVPRKLAYLLLAALRRSDSVIETTTDYRKIGDSMRDNPALLRFEAREAAALAGRLEAMGIDPARRFILFGLRDMAYYRFYGDVMAIPLEQQGRRAATHHRCPPLETYAAAAQVWAEAGHQVLRMGLRVSEPLPPGLDARVIDYASGARDDALDAFLFANCWFMIAGDTGLFSGAAAFDRPSVLSDLYLVQNTMYSSCKHTPNIFVPKLYRDTQSGSLLSFRETVYHNHAFATYESCVAAQVEVVHNAAEDLLDASRELVARLEGRHAESADDRERQRAFHTLYQPGHIGYRSTALVSAAFLRKHEALLDAPENRRK